MILKYVQNQGLKSARTTADTLDLTITKSSYSLKRLLSKYIKFKSFEKIHFTRFSLGKLENLINGIMESFGYKTGGLEFSKSALFLNMMAVILVIVTIVSLAYIFMNHKKIEKKHFFITTFYILIT